jgi:hypothetical protein
MENGATFGISREISVCPSNFELHYSEEDGAAVLNPPCEIRAERKFNHKTK